MMAEVLFAMTTVWYIPGWMRTQEPRADVMACVSNVFPNARIEFKAWDGDRLVWPLMIAGLAPWADSLLRPSPVSDRSRLRGGVSRKGEC